MGNHSSSMKGRINKSSIYEALIILSICLLAFALRIVFLDKLSFWMDEATSVLAARGLLEHGYPAMPSGEVYRRAYTHIWTMAQFFKIFGVNEFSARLPSVLFGTFSVALTYYFSKALGYKEAGLIASLMIAFSAWAIWFSREARMYAFFQFFYLASLYFLWIVFEGKSTAKKYLGLPLRKWFYLLLFTASFVIAFITHELMPLFIVIVWLYAAIMYISLSLKTGWLPALKSKYGGVTAIFSIAGFAVFILLVAMGKIPLDGQIFTKVVAKVVPEHLIEDSYLDLPGQFLLTYPFLSVMALIGSVLLARKGEKAGIYLLLSFWIPAVAITLIKVSRARYLYFIYPSFLLLAAIGIVLLAISISGSVSFDELINKLRSRFWLKISLILVLVVFSVAQFRAVKSETYGMVPHGDLCSGTHSNWKLASNTDIKGKTIITGTPTPAYYYFHRADYKLGFGELRWQWFKKKTKKERENLRDDHIGARLIYNFEDLKSVFEHNKNCLLVVEKDQWKTQLTKKARDYIWKNLKYRNELSDDSIYVFTSGDKEESHSRLVMNKNGS